MEMLFSQVSGLEKYNAKNPRSSKQMRFGDFFILGCSIYSPGDIKSFVPISLFLLSFSAFLAYNLLISNKSYNFAVEFQKSGK